MRKLAIAHPKDREVLAAYGKSLAGSRPVRTRARRGSPRPDPRISGLEAGSPQKAPILDQLGQAAQARDLYRKALDLKPNEPSVLSNLGMSYVLEGDLRTAETYMRTAVGTAGRRQPRPAEPGARRRPARPLRRGRADRAPGAVARASTGQCRLSPLHAGAAERLEAAQGQRQERRPRPTDGPDEAGIRFSQRPSGIGNRLPAGAVITRFAVGRLGDAGWLATASGGRVAAHPTCSRQISQSTCIGSTTARLLRDSRCCRRCRVR